MKLPNFKRLVRTDYAQQFGDLIDTLSGSLNIGIENLYTALNNNVSLTDNILCVVKDIQVTVDTNGVPTNITTFSISGSNFTTPKGLQVIKADNVNNPSTFPTAGIHVSYTITGQSIQIIHVTGIQANTLYQLRIVAYG